MVGDDDDDDDENVKQVWNIHNNKPQKFESSSYPFFYLCIIAHLKKCKIVIAPAAFFSGSNYSIETKKNGDGKEQGFFSIITLYGSWQSCHAH